MFPIDGDWVALLHDADRCCPEGLLSSDIILVSAIPMQRGTLRSLLSRNFGNGMQRATAYIARIDKSGSLKMARPCDSCMQALRSAGIKKIVYSTDEGNIVSEQL